ncbi:pantoate--beta-alanine ligase [Alteromonas sp. NFXS44]|uniref:pantoate--beta-alanine ligase n=1 Tax=Alteromonas sp. NFXS44 TaxID=2818435 RepID=UPI0032DF99F9
MKSLTTVEDLRVQRSAWVQAGKTVGFVPTMGNLHNGHMQLVRAAKAECDIVVVSIFVNPMQFGKNEDLDNYPRTLDADKEKLENLGVDAVFLPSVAEMYPRGLEQQTFVEVPGISSILCGESRPGHFRGVATIVCKLFNMVSPDTAFFGEKDFQQLQVIRLMAKDLSMGLSINGVPTERETSGLAMSSRNGYLTAHEREIAPVIYQQLCDMKAAILAGETDFKSLISTVSAHINKSGFRTDYLAVKNAADLTDATAASTEFVILIAAYLGSTRLIDNIHFSK